MSHPAVPKGLHGTVLVELVLLVLTIVVLIRYGGTFHLDKESLGLLPLADELFCLLQVYCCTVGTKATNPAIKQPNAEDSTRLNICLLKKGF